MIKSRERHLNKMLLFFLSQLSIITKNKTNHTKYNQLFLFYLTRNTHGRIPLQKTLKKLLFMLIFKNKHLKINKLALKTTLK